MMKDKNRFQEFTQYVSLSVFGMIATSCYILADTYFVSKGLGSSGLAALNLAIPAYNFIHGAGLMFGMGGATRYSINKSQGEHRLADIMFTNTLWLSVISSAAFMLIGLFCSGPLAALLGADETIFEMTQTYLQVLLLFSPAFILNDVLSCFVRNDGNPQLSMIAVISGSFANIILDYVFIFPTGMGIFGAVMATGVSPVIGIALMLPYWMSKKCGFHIVKTGMRADMVKINLSLGFPSLLSQLSSGIVMIVFNAIILTLAGNIGVAAYGVIANISLVVVSIYTGIAQGIQPLVSRSYGQNDPLGIRQFLRYGMISMTVLSALVYVGILAFAGPITSVFNSQNDLQLQQIAVYGMKLYFTSVLFVGFNIIIALYFTSVERALPAHIISLLRGLLLIIPMAFLLSGLWGMTGVWLAFPATELLVAALGAGMYLFYRNKLYRS